MSPDYCNSYYYRSVPALAMLAQAESPLWPTDSDSQWIMITACDVRPACFGQIGHREDHIVGRCVVKGKVDFVFSRGYLRSVSQFARRRPDDGIAQEGL
jgi:hypothetical protein